MKRIVIFSTRGGTGATSVAANLTSALNTIGQASYAIDANPQNVLRLHFAMDIHVLNGWAQQVSMNAMSEPQSIEPQLKQAWLESVYSSNRQVAFVPHGYLDSAQTDALSKMYQASPNLLVDGFTPPASKEADWQVILLPALELLQDVHISLCASADLVLCVACADFQHYALLPNSQAYRQLSKVCEPVVLLNRVEPTASHSRDMQIIFEQELENIAPIYLHQDASVNDAMLNLMTVIDYAPYSQAARDYHSLAFWCLSQLNRGEFASTMENADV